MAFKSRLNLRTPKEMLEQSYKNEDEDQELFEIKVTSLKDSPLLGRTNKIEFQARLLPFKEGITEHLAETFNYGVYDPKKKNSIPSLSFYTTTNPTLLEQYPNVFYKGGEEGLKDAAKIYNKKLYGLQKDGFLDEDTRKANYLNTRKKILVSLLIENDPVTPANNGKVMKYFMPSSIWDIICSSKKEWENDNISNLLDREEELSEILEKDPTNEEAHAELEKLQEEYNEKEFDPFDLKKGHILSIIVEPNSKKASDIYLKSSFLNQKPLTVKEIKDINNRLISFEETMLKQKKKYAWNLEKLVKEQNMSEVDALFEISRRNVQKLLGEDHPYFIKFLGRKSLSSHSEVDVEDEAFVKPTIKKASKIDDIEDFINQHEDIDEDVNVDIDEDVDETKKTKKMPF